MATSIHETGRFVAATGIAGLDDVLGGGLTRNSLYLVEGKPGSGKTTLLNSLSATLEPTSGQTLYQMRDGQWRNIYELSEAERRFLVRTDWGFVHQNPADGLRMTVSAGANVGERLMAVEVDQLTGAAAGARSPERVNYRNGYQERGWETRVGRIELAIPKTA